ncbi:hypothetical protein B0H65DRAFT_567678 [Neurospora tetraspora]|uniref:Uncharacterized protein n=1 Tax=Neurospora tetraspora TaxID=94610 RepID=A0AAE0JJK9_9PEZI|nr:hypothetical protein B0H65DRAFT_567678 [Neurospora tetraspora]
MVVVYALLPASPPGPSSSPPVLVLVLVHVAYGAGCDGTTAATQTLVCVLAWSTPGCFRERKFGSVGTMPGLFRSSKRGQGGAKKLTCDRFEARVSAGEAEKFRRPDQTGETGDKSQVQVQVHKFRSGRKKRSRNQKLWEWMEFVLAVKMNGLGGLFRNESTCKFYKPTMNPDRPAGRHGPEFELRVFNSFPVGEDAYDIGIGMDFRAVGS